MTDLTRAAALALAIALAGAPAAAAPKFEASVTRFHSSAPAAGTTLFVEAPEGDTATLEQAAHLAAIADALAAAGFLIVPTREEASLVAVPRYQQRLREAPPKRSPVSIGIGGGSFGRSGGVSLGTSFGIGGKKSGEIATSTLELQLRDVAGNAVWEGRAETEAYSDDKRAPLAAAIPALARALLHDYPGSPGTTVRYKDGK